MPRVGWRNETSFHNANFTLWTEPLWFLISSIIAAFPHQISHCSPSSPSLSSSILISLCFLKAELCFSSQGQGPIVCHSYLRDKSSATHWPLLSWCRGLCILQSFCCVIITSLSVQYSVIWLQCGLHLRKQPDWKVQNGFIGNFKGGGVFYIE